VRNHVDVFNIELLDIIGSVDCHTCWSLELSVLVLGFWKSLGNLSKVPWASDCLQ
jgi:hypothetical protein